MKTKTNVDEVAYYHGVVYTADAKRPVAQAFIVRNGRFVCVGGDEIASGCPRKVDLKGACVIPGLVDSHCHLLAGILRDALGVMDLPHETKPHELGEAILNAMAGREAPKDTLIAAMGISLTQGDFSAADIDRVISVSPVVVFTDDGHALLLNSKAMAILGVDENTKDPGEKSYFKRDTQGRPTGLVIEIAAMGLCMPLIENARKNPMDVLRKVYRQYAAYGYTTVFEAMSADDENCEYYEALSAIAKGDDPGLRISTSFCYRGENTLSAEASIAVMRSLRERFSCPNLICDTLKLILDGTVEEHTALLYEPYADDPNNTGSLMMGLEEMEKMASLAAAGGFNIHIHAIGDRAVGIAIDLLNGLGPIAGTKTIAHNQLYSETDIQKITKAGDIFFQTTPQWVKSDDFTLKCLGEKRYSMQFPCNTMIRNGVKVTFGSDSCLEEHTANPFTGMYYASARGEAEYEGLCFPPLSEGIDRTDCLLAYTLNGAEQIGLSHETGSIEAGKSADFVILDRNIMTCPLEDLKNTRVVETYFSGQSVYLNRRDDSGNRCVKYTP